MKIKDYYIEIIWLMLIVFIGILVPKIHYVILLGMIGMFCFFLNKWMKQHSLAVPKLIIVAILLQNTLMGIGMHNFGVEGHTITLYSQLPTIFIFIAGTLILIIQLDRHEHALFYVYILIIIFNYLISPYKSLTSLAYNFRNFTCFYMCFLIGRYYINSEDKFKEFSRFFIRACIVAGVVGVIAYLTDSKLYVWMGALEVAVVKMNNANLSINNGDLPAYFHGEFFGKFYWRMASLFLEPVNFSSFMALAVILKSVELKKAIDWLEWIFLIICNFLTFGKGGLLIAFVSISSLLIYRVINVECNISRKQVLQTTKWGLIVFVIVFGFIYATLFPNNMHFYAIKLTINELLHKPFGFGVGSVGNMNRVELENSSSYLGAETGVLNFWCQLGLEGIIVFALLLYNMSKKCYKTYIVQKTKLTFVFTLMPILLFLVFIFQENTFTTQVITGYMFVVGYVIAEYDNAIKAYQ